MLDARIPARILTNENAHQTASVPEADQPTTDMHAYVKRSGTATQHGNGGTGRYQRLTTAPGALVQTLEL
ncbi:hypothetical protein [Xanthomonas albilineans]|uniref:hypothetical protein n=1 Tax=Xanthomonas albilineans TaxID=29447 RepID=UPI0005F33094|nr:hypothetical protein [Xanthomonas albilineans]QHQ27857.1 hypothetical protein XaFJ1_GM001110 [Xanthomonas albilineans]